MDAATGIGIGARQAVAGALHRTGILAAYHRATHRQALTVVALHRVLDREEPRWAEAHRTWTVSTRFLDGCLRFFQRHYSVVGLDDVAAAMRGDAVLPPCPLLITFDDGWADNLERALPVLQRHGVPSALFMVAESLEGGTLWQEPLLRAWAAGRITSTDCLPLWEALGAPPRPESGPSELQELLVRLGDLERDRRESLLGPLRSRCAWPVEREMLLPEQMRALRNAGVTIGSHGLTHAPIALVEDPSRELRVSRELLEKELDAPVTALAFPHGSYDARVLDAAREAGYRLLFTSDACLNPCAPARRACALLGRIPLIEADLADARGEARTDLLARWLFLRPSRSLP